MKMIECKLSFAVPDYIADSTIAYDELETEIESAARDAIVEMAGYEGCDNATITELIAPHDSTGANWEWGGGCECVGSGASPTDILIDALKLPTTTRNALRKAGIVKVGDLIRHGRLECIAGISAVGAGHILREVLALYEVNERMNGGAK